MAVKVKIRWNNKGFKQILNSPELTSELYAAAGHVAKEAGEGFTTHGWQSSMKGGRPAVTVEASTDKAKRAEATDKTLTKAVQRCRKG